MTSGPTGMFEDFNRSGRLSDSSDVLSALVVRPARLEDADEIGRTSRCTRASVSSRQHEELSSQGCPSSGAKECSSGPV